MRILEIIPKLGAGGAEKFTVDLSNEMNRQGHEVILATLYDIDDSCILEQFVESRNVRRILLGKKVGFDLRMYYKVYKLIRNIKPDIVHVHVGAIKYITIVATLYNKCIYFATIHSEAKREAGKGIELYSRKYLFKYRHIFPITISESSQKSFNNFYKINSELIVNGCSPYIRGSLNLSDLNVSNTILFVHVARLQKVKNQIVLCKAFNRLIKDGYDVKLLLIGRNDHKDIYDRISSYFSDRIVYLGEKDNPRSYMASADAFCLTSSMEGMPITIIEAFSVGCVPIVTPVGGCVNMINNGVNGLISESCNDDDYYKALKKFVTMKKEQINELKANARKTFENSYSIQVVAKKYLDYFSLHV